MGDKTTEPKRYTLKEVVSIVTTIVICCWTYFQSTSKADIADNRSRKNEVTIQENKAFGIARDKKIEEVKITSREYARDYAYRKDSEIIKDVKKNSDAIHAIREEMVETRVKLSHIEKNQERTLLLLEQLINKK